MANISLKQLFRSVQLLSVIALTMLITACSSRSIMIDTAQDVNFEQLQSFAVTILDSQDAISNQRLYQITETFLNNQNKLVGDASHADATIEIDHFIEERPNDKSFSIGLGTGAGGRSGGIGVGGSVNLPLGADTIPYAIVTVKVLLGERLVWSAKNYAEIDTDQDSGLGDAQREALTEILEQLISA